MPEMGIRLGVLASGRGSNLQAIIDAVEGKKINAEIAVVISDKEQSKALERAKRHQLTGIFLDPEQFSSKEEYDEQIEGILKEHGAELVILAGYMRIVTSRLIHAYKTKMINIHPSLLPSFPGLRSQKKALEWGGKISGCTVHIVEETVDQGPIVIQAAVPIQSDDTEDSLASRILEQEHRILPQAIQYFAEGRLDIVGRRVIIRGAKPDAAGTFVSPLIEGDL